MSNRDTEKCFSVFEDFDRFEFPAEYIYRVTAGKGGEAIMIAGRDKTALIDCGMAFCGREMVANVKSVLETLGKTSLDYVFLSHSHYDHMGALPYITEAFPDAVIYGSAKAQSILSKESARKLMKELGTSAQKMYAPENTEEIPVEGLKVDTVIYDGDEIDLGDMQIIALETKGHTDCSMSFALEPLSLLFTSETTGILINKEFLHTPILKNFDDAKVSLEKCKGYGAKYICLPHFGMLPEYFNDEYWAMLEKFYYEKRAYIKGLYEAGESEEEILAKYSEKYWHPEMAEEQPREAYLINCKDIVKAVLNSVR